jgi:D-aminoacyl-tRNA deacylase
MRVIIQRVKKASVSIDNRIVGSIDAGLLVLFGVEKDDHQFPQHIPWLVNKIVGLRIFQDEQGKMNRSVLDIGGNILVISQFNLFADTKSGFRPSFVGSARPEEAIPIYEQFLRVLEARMDRKVPCGEFGADMDVELINHGPVTIIMDTRQ